MDLQRDYKIEMEACACITKDACNSRGRDCICDLAAEMLVTVETQRAEIKYRRTMQYGARATWVALMPLYVFCWVALAARVPAEKLYSIVWYGLVVSLVIMILAALARPRERTASKA